MQNNKWIQELAETYREMLAEYMFTARHAEELRQQRLQQGKPNPITQLIQNVAQQKGGIKPPGVRREEEELREFGKQPTEQELYKELLKKKTLPSGDPRLS